MALPRPIRSRLLRFALAPALVLAAVTVAAADGAVVAPCGDEPLPASRIPASRSSTATRAPHAPSVPTQSKSPCPNPHKCAGAAPAKAAQD